MKKFLAIALIAASFAACNEGETKVEETTTTETTVPAVDSMATPAGDSMAIPAAMDTTTKM